MVVKLQPLLSRKWFLCGILLDLNNIQTNWESEYLCCKIEKDIGKEKERVEGLKKKAIGPWLFLIFAFILACGLIEWWNLGRYGQLGAFLLLAGAFYYFKRKLMSPEPSPTASAAIVMSAGVFVSDLFKEFPNEVDSIVHLSVIVIFLIE